MTRRTIHVLGGAVAVVLAAGLASAHVTPPVVLISDRDAAVRLLSGARKFFVREVRLTDAEREAIEKQTGWSPQEDFYRFYLGRDEAGQLVASAIFLTEYTMHGPVRVGVGLDPAGKVRDAVVMELSEETYPWLKPLLDQNFTRQYAGLDRTSTFGLSGSASGPGVHQMGQFYAQVVGGIVHRGVILYDQTILKRPS